MNYNAYEFSYDDDNFEGLPVSYVGSYDEDGISFSVVLRSTDPRLDGVALDDIIGGKEMTRLYGTVEELLTADLKDREDEYAIMRWESQRDDAWL